MDRFDPIYGLSEVEENLKDEEQPFLMWIKENMDLCGFLIFWENIMGNAQNGQEKIAISELARTGARELKRLSESGLFQQLFKCYIFALLVKLIV